MWHLCPNLPYPVFPADAWWLPVSVLAAWSTVMDTYRLFCQTDFPHSSTQKLICKTKGAGSTTTHIHNQQTQTNMQTFTVSAVCFFRFLFPREAVTRGFNLVFQSHVSLHPLRLFYNISVSVFVLFPTPLLLHLPVSQVLMSMCLCESFSCDDEKKKYLCLKLFREIMTEVTTI